MIIYVGKQKQNEKMPVKEKKIRDSPGGPVTKTLSSWCRSAGFDPWLGNWIPHAATKT